MFKLAKFMYELGIKMERRRIRMIAVEAQRQYHVKHRGFDLHFSAGKEEPTFDDLQDLEIDKRVAGILMELMTQQEVTKFTPSLLDQDNDKA